LKRNNKKIPTWVHERRRELRGGNQAPQNPVVETPQGPDNSKQSENVLPKDKPQATPAPISKPEAEPKKEQEQKRPLVKTSSPELEIIAEKRSYSPSYEPPPPAKKQRPQPPKRLQDIRVQTDKESPYSKLMGDLRGYHELSDDIKNMINETLSPVTTAITAIETRFTAHYNSMERSMINLEHRIRENYTEALKLRQDVRQIVSSVKETVKFSSNEVKREYQNSLDDFVLRTGDLLNHQTKELLEKIKITVPVAFVEQGPADADGAAPVGPEPPNDVGAPNDADGPLTPGWSSPGEPVKQGEQDVEEECDQFLADLEGAPPAPCPSPLVANSPVLHLQDLVHQPLDPIPTEPIYDPVESPAENVASSSISTPPAPALPAKTRSTRCGTN
jgi:uncharacterized protein YeeX (DUF496 family)